MLLRESHNGAAMTARPDIRLAGRLAAPVLLAMMAVAAFLVLYPVATGRAVVGPEGTYTEANGDIIEICADAACITHINTFNNTAPGNIIYVRVTTARVANRSSGNLRLYNYRHVAVGTAGNWTQVSATSPYVYTSAVTVPAGNTVSLKLVGTIVSGTGARIQFEQALDLNGINRFLHFYSDAGRADESYTFRPGATMYIRACGNGNAYSSSQTGTNNRMYSFTNAQVGSAWAAPAVTQNGNDYDFSLALPAAGLTDGNWYWVRTYLRNSFGTTIERNSRMIQIDSSSPIAAITSPAALQTINTLVPIVGTADDAISFNQYIVEYGAGAAPATWTQIGGPGPSPVTVGLLQTWNTTAVADGVYTLRLTVSDRAYNTSQASVQVTVDNSPPVISSVLSTAITGSGATISWTTDEGADSQVEYGTSPGNYSASTMLDPTLLTSHSQSLSGLQPSTTYFYRVRSADAFGQASYSAEQSLVTANRTVLQPFPAVGSDAYYGTAQPAWNRGAEAVLSAGDSTSPGLGTLRSTVRFDLSGIPTGATIVSAGVSLYQMAQGDASSPILQVHRLTRGWAEGSGTGSATADGIDWNTCDGSGSWTTPGGDYSALPSGSVAAPNSTSSWVDWDITSLTQSWIDGSATNHGILIRQNVENPAVSDAKSYYSADHIADRTLRPRITIEWFGADNAAPAVGEVRAENITRTAAAIKWSTDEQGNSQVEYGTTTSYGSSTTIDATMVNQHSVPLSGLTEDTVFHYRIKSTDASGNQTVSADHVFQTARLITIQPSPAPGRDSWLTSSAPTLNYGGATDITVGDNAAGGEVRRGLIRFDLSAISMGSTVNSATFSLYQHAQQDNSTPQVGVYSVTRPWSEGTGNGAATGDGATWNTSDGAVNWTAAGGDYNAAVRATAIAPVSTAAWVDFDITGLAQEWVGGTLGNEGMILRKTSEGAGNDFKTFYSSDYLIDTSLRPRLVIEYVPAPGSMTISVNETFNRDGSAGGGSVGFGGVSPGTTYDVGDGMSPPYSVKLTVISNTQWGIKSAATGDLAQVDPSNTINISNLKWKQDGEGPAAYADFVKSPAETVVTSGEDATNGYPFFFDYRLVVPSMVVSGSYATAIVYTAFPT